MNTIRRMITNRLRAGKRSGVGEFNDGGPWAKPIGHPLRGTQGEGGDTSKPNRMDPRNCEFETPVGPRGENLFAEIKESGASAEWRDKTAADQAALRHPRLRCAPREECRQALVDPRNGGGAHSCHDVAVFPFRDGFGSVQPFSASN